MSLETSMCTVSATICILSLRILQQINVVLGLTFSAAVSAVWGLLSLRECEYRFTFLLYGVKQMDRLTDWVTDWQVEQSKLCSLKESELHVLGLH